MSGENSRETQALIAGEVERVCFLERQEARLARRCVVRMLCQLAAATFAVVVIVQGALLFALSHLEQLEGHAKHAIVAIVVTAGWAAFLLARAIITQGVKPWRVAVNDTRNARLRLRNLLGS